MPFERGRAPISSATLTPSKASFGSAVMSMLFRSGNAQSTSSMAVPSAALSASGISSMRRSIASSGPSICPDAIRNRIAYPIWPAAPVTATRAIYEFISSITASANSLVPTAEGSSRVGFRS